jgi:hypothetical protein
MSVSTVTPKKRGRPPLVKITKPSRGRGRPPKVRPKYFTTDSSLDDIQQLSASISDTLGIPVNSVLATSLAMAAVRYDVMEQIQSQAPLKRKGPGNRPKIHKQRLLRECAVIHENLTGEPAKPALSKIGGRDEDVGKKRQILIYAEAVLAALNVKHGSLRRQARRAMNLFE